MEKNLREKGIVNQCLPSTIYHNLSYESTKVILKLCSS